MCVCVCVCVYVGRFLFILGDVFEDLQGRPDTVSSAESYTYLTVIKFNL